MYDLPKINPLLKVVNINFLIPTKGEASSIQQEMYKYVNHDLAYSGLGKKTLIYCTGYTSIFNAYSRGLELVQENQQLKDSDIFVLCHDDISIHTKADIFIKILTEALEPKTVGFVGVAGTSELRGDAVWWNRDCYNEQKLRGYVLHGKEMASTYYGPPGRVVVLDGLFLACTYRTLKQINLSKPDTFVGDWDFYDLYYTLQAHKLGLCNLVVPIVVNHMSRGELVGKDGWHNNRGAFIAANTGKFPIKI